jgi:hypothetical protein
MLAKGEMRNPHNIRAGFKACGIYPLDMSKVLARLPPERTASEVRDDFHADLTAELERNRYGEQKKATRAKKANRLPPGTAYTVSVAPPQDPEEAGKYCTLTVPYIPYLRYWYQVRYKVFYAQLNLCTLTSTDSKF